MCVHKLHNTQPHRVYAPVETISNSLASMLGRHSLGEIQAKREKSREEQWMGRVGWDIKGWQNQEKMDERKRQSVTDWHTHTHTRTPPTHTHTKTHTDKTEDKWGDVLAVLHNTERKEREHQGKRQNSSFLFWLTRDGLDFDTIWWNLPKTVSMLWKKHSLSLITKPEYVKLSKIQPALKSGMVGVICETLWSLPEGSHLMITLTRSCEVQYIDEQSNKEAHVNSGRASEMSGSCTRICGQENKEHWEVKKVIRSSIYIFATNCVGDTAKMRFSCQMRPKLNFSVNSVTWCWQHIAVGKFFFSRGRKAA